MYKTKKKIILHSFLSLFFLFSAVYFLISDAYAATTPTPLPSRNEVPTDSAAIEKIQKIKDIVASKVAELNLVEKRGIIGTIKETANTQVTITDLAGVTRIVDIDELTKFNISNPDKTAKEKDESLGISDLKKDTYYSFIGLFNKDTKRLMARFVSQPKNLPVFFEGVVSAMSENDFQLTVFNEKGDKKLVDVERSTKTNIQTDGEELLKSGFSKIAVQERVLIIGFDDLKEKNKIIASRLIHFKDVPPSKEMLRYISLEDTPPISSGSGKKLEVIQKPKANTGL